MVAMTCVHPGHPGLAHEGSRDQTNKRQRRADWLRRARDHRAGAWPTKNSTKADVSVTTPATQARVKLGGYGVARGVLSIAPAC